MSVDQTMQGTLPWTKGCFVCGEENERGLKLRSRIENGRVKLDYKTRQTDLGWRTAVHGGITMMLLDEVMSWASIIASGSACVTAEMTTRMKLPVQAGQTVHVEGWVTRNMRKMLLTESTLTGENGTILATATGKYMPMPGEQFKICAEDFVSSKTAIPPDSLITE